MPVLHIICGLPGSGKTTLARKLEAAGQGLRLEPDEWMLSLGFDLYDGVMRERVEGLQWSMARRLLTGGTSVILENGFWSRSERDRYRIEAKACGAETTVHYLEVGLDELRNRIIQRNERLPVEARVDPEHLEGWARLFEPLTEAERLEP